MRASNIHSRGFMNASELAHTVFAGYDNTAGVIHLQVFTADGQMHTYVLADTETLRASLVRAERAKEQGDQEKALLIKSQPAGVVLGRFDV